MVYVDPLLRSKALTKLEQNKRVNITDAGSILGIHKVTVKDYIIRGLLRSIVISGRHYITEAEIDRFLEERRKY